MRHGKETLQNTISTDPLERSSALLAGGKREEAEKFLRLEISRAVAGDERDRLSARLAGIHEASGDWRKAAAVWKKIMERGESRNREVAVFEWVRTTQAIGGNHEHEQGYATLQLALSRRARRAS